MVTFGRFARTAERWQLQIYAGLSLRRLWAHKRRFPQFVLSGGFRLAERRSLQHAATTQMRRERSSGPPQHTEQRSDEMEDAISFDLRREVLPQCTRIRFCRRQFQKANLNKPYPTSDNISAPGIPIGGTNQPPVLSSFGAAGCVAGEARSRAPLGAASAPTFKLNSPHRVPATAKAPRYSPSCRRCHRPSGPATAPRS